MKDGRHAAVDSSGWTTVWTYGTDGVCPAGFTITPESQELHVRITPFHGEAVEAYVNSTSTSVVGAIVIPSGARRTLLFEYPSQVTALLVRAAAGSTTFLIERFQPPKP